MAGASCVVQVVKLKSMSSRDAQLQLQFLSESNPNPYRTRTHLARARVYVLGPTRKSLTVMVSLDSEALDFLARICSIPSEHPRGAQRESCGGRPLARVTCDAARGPKQ